MAGHQNKVSGHLEIKRDIFHMVINWNENSSRKRQTISTGLPKKGNKMRAKDMLDDAISKKEQALYDLELRVSNEPPKTEMLVADLLEEWLSSVKNDLKPTTYGNYELAISRTIGPYFRARDISICQVTAKDIQDFYKSKDVKAATLHKYHNNLSCAFKYAIEEGYMDKSPMEKVKRPRIERYSAKFLKQSEAVALFEAVRGHKLELGVIMAAYYGLRRGEIVGLRWESIDFERNTITIEHTVTVAQVNGKKTIVESDTAKTKSSLRSLPLVPQFRQTLEVLKAQKEANMKLFGKSYNKKEGQYIYTDPLGNRIRPDYLTAEFPKFLVNNGFRKMRFHDMRHSCASLLLASGVSLKQIQDWLGHSSFKVTADAYAHLDYASKVSAANAMTWIGNTTLGQTKST